MEFLVRSNVRISPVIPVSWRTGRYWLEHSVGEAANSESNRLRIVPMPADIDGIQVHSRWDQVLGGSSRCGALQPQSS